MASRTNLLAKLLYEKIWHDDAKNGLALEAKYQSRLISSTNLLEAVNANFENRQAEFKSRKKP